MDPTIPFIEYLKKADIPFSGPTPEQGLVVHGNLDLSKHGNIVLPENLRVQGWMLIGGWGLTRLPAQLVVAGDLNMVHARIAALPRHLYVGANITLDHCPITHLPDSIHQVRGSLNLSGCPIAVLPEGLDVAGYLHLSGTHIAHLPKRLRVGRMITPPSRLWDIQAFMRGQPREVVLNASGSRHQRMQLRERLQAYPDVWTIVESMGDRSLHLRRGWLGQIQLHVGSGHAPD